MKYLADMPNRAVFIKKLNQILAQKKEQTYKAAVFFVGIDNFADINYVYGYKFGDDVLINIGKLINTMFYGDEFMSHYEGDSIALFLPNISDYDHVIYLAKKIIKAFHMPWRFGEHECYITVSVGISMYPDDGKSAEKLTKDAEFALISASKNGRSQYQFCTKVTDMRITKRLSIEYNLRRALENEEFVLYYQPQVNIATGEIISLEALIRWIHPKEGVISPDEFIPVADETGLINPIGKWVMKTACRQIKALNDMTDSKIMLAVNLSPYQFKNPRLHDDIFKIIEDTEFDSELLELEITEESAIKDINSTLRLLKKLRGKKIRIALDDFCTGYSSLCYLELLPIDKIKIDKSFVDGMIYNYKKKAIVESLISLAHKLDIDVVAEGVEQMLQNEMLKQKKCDMVQGYYFCKPLPFDVLTHYVSERTTELKQM